jgi:hypothetical protein
MSWLSYLNRKQNKDLWVKENFAPDRRTLDHYIQCRALLLRGCSEVALAESCFFESMQLKSCSNKVAVNFKPRLVSFKAGKFRLAFEEFPICPKCRVDCKDRYRAKLNQWSEEEMWQELVPACWFTGARSTGGSPKLFVHDRTFAQALGTGFALRTMLREPVPTAPAMTIPPDSYYVQKGRMPKRNYCGAESFLDSIIKKAEEA